MSPIRPRSPLQSFAVRWLIFAESVDHRGLGRSKLDPFRAVELHPFVELFRELEGLLAYVVEPIELALKGELAGQRFFQRSTAPDRASGLTLEVVSEVNHAHRVLHFLDSTVVNQHHFGPGPDIDVLEGRKGFGDVLDTAVQLNLGRSQHASMRIDTAHPAEAVAREQ